MPWSTCQSGGIDALIPNLSNRPLYSWGMWPWYPLSGRPDTGSNDGLDTLENTKHKHLLCLPGIETRFLSCLAWSLVIILTKYLSSLLAPYNSFHYCMRAAHIGVLHVQSTSEHYGRTRTEEKFFLKKEHIATLFCARKCN